MTRILFFLMLFSTPVLAKEPVRVSVGWDGLSTEVDNRVLLVDRVNGKKIKGRLTAVEATGLTLDSGSKGAITIARSDIRRLRVARRQRGIRGRVIGTAIPAGVAVFATWVIAALATNEGVDFTRPVFLGSIGVLGGFVAGGYLIGDALDARWVELVVK